MPDVYIFNKIKAGDKLKIGVTAAQIMGGFLLLRDAIRGQPKEENTQPLTEEQELRKEIREDYDSTINRKSVARQYVERTAKAAIGSYLFFSGIYDVCRPIDTRIYGARHQAVQPAQAQQGQNALDLMQQLQGR